MHKKASLSVQLLGGIVLILIASGLIFAWLAANYQHKQINASTLRRLDDLTNSIEISSEAFSETKDKTQIQRIVSNFAADASILEIAITDPSGKVVAHTDYKQLRRPLDSPYFPSATKLMEEARTQGKTITGESGATLIRVIPISGLFDGGTGTGFIFIALDLSPADIAAAQAKRAIVLGTLAATAGLGLLFHLFLRWMIVTPLRRLAVAASKSTVTGEFLVPDGLRGQEITEVAGAMHSAFGKLSENQAALTEARDTLDTQVRERTRQLQEKLELIENQDWLKTNLAEILRRLQGRASLRETAETLMRELPVRVRATQAVFYQMETTAGEESLWLLAAYAPSRHRETPTRFRMGEGLPGQCALEKRAILVENAPGDDGPQIVSGLFQTAPRRILLQPIIFEGKVEGVLELATLQEFAPQESALISEVAESAGILFHSVAASALTARLLQESCELSAELRQTNVELHAKSEQLQVSEEELRVQQEELRHSNDELRARTSELEEKRRALEEQSRQLQESSAYKSEFLANMSHELRTPLNSILILAEMLGRNDAGRLSAKEAQYARTIESSGRDLLTLINDVLDMSKVEAGFLEVRPGRTSVQEILLALRGRFAPLSAKKGLELHLESDPDAPEFIVSDAHRLGQILTNLLSNAVKFTDSGSVRLQVRNGSLPGATDGRAAVRFEVQDTGPGIPEDKIGKVFDAFYQVDGSNSRQFGGTGLGLAISQKLARLLGGEITAASQPGQGCLFTLVLPEDGPQPAASAAAPVRSIPVTVAPIARSPAPTPLPSPSAVELPPDRTHLVEDKTVLIVEDDPEFAAILRDLALRHHFQPVLASRGDSGLALARQLRPAAVILDRQLPVLDGLSVLERLKQDPLTRAIPVHVISASENTQEALLCGAVSSLAKPVQSAALENVFQQIETFSPGALRHVLVVEDDDSQQIAITALLSGRDVEITTARTEAEALARLKEGHMDCMVLDLSLPDMNGYELLDQLKDMPSVRPVPAIIYTGRELSEDETWKLRRYARTIVIKGVESPQRLLAEVTLFLHSVESGLPEDKRRLLQQLWLEDRTMKGMTVLIADDDIRNIYSMQSLLEDEGLEVITARNGREAVRAVSASKNISLVLMDIMMPEMDGYEATRQIRRLEGGARLPIIAVTAKAMKDDRDKCMAAGASDYITKPIDNQQLVSLLRVWLYRPSAPTPRPFPSNA